eukprot:CAMPEP_0181213230 /NCGR_PEP_ID=MMETSP1096-20121128/24789_1 /TAXON_ID=156174 ORGANISM="Chrysochromulina ericina, Strain CCMP281" /NCGR_SAMPLE_ID=MMETSP1096 /ASSEMBLY_ACC=CAM_ASM_000453 /LENGTH=87 /DNA_ID=CAMNT_0023304845 /DNA_START=510 /DNA_END=776 /DNA_ORIENTATION=-
MTLPPVAWQAKDSVVAGTNDEGDPRGSCRRASCANASVLGCTCGNHAGTRLQSSMYDVTSLAADASGHMSFPVGSTMKIRERGTPTA